MIDKVSTYYKNNTFFYIKSSQTFDIFYNLIRVILLADVFLIILVSKKRCVAYFRFF